MPTGKIPISSQRALDIWPHLIEQAHLKRTITYGVLSEKVYGRRASLSLSRSLNKLCAYCKAKGLPLLPILAVSKSTGEPSAGPDVYPDIPGETQRVFDFYRRHVPSPALTDLD